jgi:CheY-like chemotaxis protein
MTVEDTGTGISPDIMPKIFDPFFTTKPIGKGTGLGLSTVYGIVKQNGGLIFVDSQVGKGTTFKVYFPIVDESVHVVQTPSKEIGILKGDETILVVEDEEDLRNLVCETLKSNGYKVLMASNGAEALAILKTHGKKIHLIITDVVMPQGGGSELARHAQAIDKDVKILFQSGYTEDTLIQNGIHAGKIHFLEKPYTIKVFLSKVRTILA